MVTPFAEWPQWLQLVVMVPHGILAAITMWVWWPKTNREWRRFGMVAAYLVVFLVVMIWVFHFM